MCQSYRKTCSCGHQTSEIFFGKYILDEKAVAEVYCPQCSQDINSKKDNRVWDNGWVLELDMQVVRARAAMMETSAEDVTAEWVFDEGYAPGWASHLTTFRPERGSALKSKKSPRPISGNICRP